MKIYSQEYFLHKILECSQEELEQAKTQKGSVCQEDDIPKKEGYRKIVSVKPGCDLLRLQKNLHKNFLSKLPVSPSAKGFLKGYSYIDFLEEHIGHEYFLRLDIKDFFDSITKDMLKESLSPFAEEVIKPEIVELCTLDIEESQGSVTRVPQGFVTSPAVSNLVLRRIDQRIRKYCRAYYKEMSREIFYTRYADDMLFSSVGFNFKKHKNFKRMIAHILEENGFSLNESKTIFKKEEISLSGYVIHNDVHLSRKKLRNINEVIFQFDSRESYNDRPFKLKKENFDTQKILVNLNARKLKRADGTIIEFPDIRSIVHYIAGYRSFLIQIIKAPHGDTGYDKQIAKKIKKLEFILDYLSELLGETQDGR